MPQATMHRDTSRWVVQAHAKVYRIRLIGPRGRGLHARVEIRYYIDPETELLHIYRHNVTEQDVEDVLRRPIEDRPGREHSVPSRRQGAAGGPPPQEEAMRPSKYPAGWDEERVRRVLEHYETQSDEEAVAEDEAAYEETTHTAMEVPVELVPVVRELIAKRRTG